MTKANPKSSGFDAFDTQSDCDVPFEFELNNKFGDPSGLFITVVGKDSKVFEEHIERASEEHLRKRAAAQKRGKEADAPSLQRIKDEAIDLLVACTVSWRAEEKFGPLDPFTKEAARDVYSRFKHVREQVDEAIGDISNFIKA